MALSGTENVFGWAPVVAAARHLVDRGLTPSGALPDVDPKKEVILV